MRTKSSRRLAGCIAIELLLIPLAFAADLEFRAGAASSAEAKALVVEDRRGFRIAIVEARFAVTRAVSDFAGARLMQSYELDRAGVLLRGRSDAAPRTEDLVNAVAAALGKFEPAALRFGEGGLAATSTDGRCIGAIALDATLNLDRCPAGEPVHGPIRAAFQIVEPAHGLLQRDASPTVYPIQAIAFGKQARILALGGDSAVTRFRAKGTIVATFANDNQRLPDTPAVTSAIRRLLERVK
jgi:hypothetical protein